jgi:hypothetical protein
VSGRPGDLVRNSDQLEPFSERIGQRRGDLVDDLQHVSEGQKGMTAGEAGNLPKL